MEKRRTSVSKNEETLSVRVLLQKPKLSKSGKTKVIGTTHGPFITHFEYEGQPIVVNLNAFVYATEGDEKRDGSANVPKHAVLKKHRRG